MTNSERRDKGLLYISDEAVMQEQAAARRLTQKLNTMDRADFEGLRAVVKQLLGRSEGATINPPFYCDYGKHIEVGKNFFANYNCTILDVGKVIIGDNCQLAPNVSIYTAGHPIHPASRNTLFEYGAEVIIGNNVWIGGNTVVCPGVRIGDNVVIGAGSVVTHDIPDWTVAAGNPCRVIREITEEDRWVYFRGQGIDEEAMREMQLIWRVASDGVRFPESSGHKEV
ncbi:MAG: sugar O-acetyltransferase [Fretibacterium sp.]|nr:sugar O-acetyltransferase [Fretibacterium sp.]